MIKEVRAQHAQTSEATAVAADENNDAMLPENWQVSNPPAEALHKRALYRCLSSGTQARLYKGYAMRYSQSTAQAIRDCTSAASQHPRCFVP